MNHSHSNPFSLTRLSAAMVFTLAAVFLSAGPALAQSNPGPSDSVCERLELLGVAPPVCQRDGDLSPEVERQLNQLQRTVLPFFNFDVAEAAGWDTIISECVEIPIGGMGYHVANLDQLGSGELNLLRPEVLLFAPTEDGSMEFHGVEYIIPADLWDSTEAPEFLGQELHFNPNVPPNGIWALHVWVGTENPTGIFEDFNPDVSCEFAPDGG